MQKSARLFILAAFFTGGALGYFRLLPSLKQDNSPSTAKATHADGRASALKLVRNDSQGRQNLPSKNTLNNFLLKYAELSPQETKTELERLLKAQKDDKKQDYFLHRAIHYLAFKLAFQSPEEAKRLLDDKGTPDKAALYTTLLEGWAEKDFQGAMDYLLAHKNEFRHSIQAFQTLAANLVTKDTDTALKWLSTLTPGERETALDTMADSLPKLHPEKISAFLSTLTRGEQHSYSIITKLASNWAVSDWDAFKTWAGTLKKHEQEYVFSSALEGLSQADLAKATEKMRELGKKHSSETVRSIIYGMDYEEKKQGKAIDWVMENKDYFEDLPSAMERAANASSYSDNPVLTEKILKLPEGEIRDSALSGMIESQASFWSNDYNENINNRYTSLLELAGKIGDSKKRDETIINSMRGWIYGEPENARQWITEKSQLSPQQKQDLLNQCDERLKEKKSEFTN